MGFFSDFFGSTQRRDASQSYQDSTQTLNSALDQARGALSDGQRASSAALTRGYDTSREALTGGYNQARADIGTGYDRAAGNINQGYDRAIGSAEDYLARTGNILDPYIQRGNQAGDTYANFLGLNGAEAQAGAQDGFTGTLNPYSEVDARALEETNRQLNSQGITGGRAALAVTRSSQQRNESRLGDYLNRLQGMYGQGQTASGQLAGYTNQTGQTVGGYEASRGNALAGNDTARGTALGGLSSQYGRDASALDYRYGQDSANNVGGYYGNLASLDYGAGQQQAANRISYGNALSSSRSTGINNLLGAVGIGISAVRPTPTRNSLAM